MAVHPDRGFHPIRILHILACLALGLAFGWYAWRNHPVRRVGTARFRLSPVTGGHSASPAIAELLNRRLALANVILPDLLGGITVLALFALGTGVYARRLEVWLEVHQAGEAASLRGVGLDRVALGANKDRRKGAAL